MSPTDNECKSSELIDAFTVQEAAPASLWNVEGFVDPL